MSIEINETHRAICSSFLQMLKTLKFEDVEGMEVAAQCLAAGFGIEGDAAATEDLVAVWESHGKGGDAATSEDDAKFQEFLLIVKQRGYFNGVEEGSAEYNARLEKAKAKFRARQNPYEGMTAEQLKTKGNELMSQSKHKDALGYYTKAVELEPSNHLYHANRAAANIHLQDYKTAVADCEKSIALNATYSKSFSRLGTAHFYDNNFQRAVDAYRKALDLDPENERYKEDLRSAEEKLQQQRANPFAGFPGLGAGGPGGFDMSSMMSMMNNPQFMNMATQFMQNPEFNGVVQNFARQMGMQAPNPQELQDFMQNMSSGQDLSAPDDPNSVQTPFGRINKEELSKLQEDEIRNNPKLAAIVEDVRANGPAAFSRHMGDPEVMQLMSKFSTMFSGNNNGTGGALPPSGGPQDPPAPTS